MDWKVPVKLDEDRLGNRIDGIFPSLVFTEP